MNTSDIRKLAIQRLDEAELLLDQNKIDTAFYLAGYSVELTLKAKLCSRFHTPNLFAKNSSISNNLKKVIYTHDLNDLMFLCGLSTKYSNLSKASTLYINTNFILKNWKTEIRYYKPNFTQVEIKNIISFLKDKEGLLKWINKN